MQTRILFGVLGSFFLFFTACDQPKESNVGAHSSNVPIPNTERSMCQIIKKKEIRTRVINGIAVEESDPTNIHHSTVSIFTARRSGCTAVLITENFLLTARHCFDGTQKDQDVHYAFFSTKSIPFNKIGKVYGAESQFMDEVKPYTITFPNKAVYLSENHDLALIDLSLSNNCNQQANYFPAKIYSGPSLSRGDPLILAGYGVRSSDLSAEPSISDTYGKNYGQLYQAEAKFIVYGYDLAQSDSTMADKILISGKDDTIGVCHGDSGGPAYTKIGDNYEVVGIAKAVVPLRDSRTSRYIPGSCDPASPAWYTDLSDNDVREWIGSILH